MNNYSAIALWVYFGFNFPDPKPMFITIYGENLGTHIYNKWVQYDGNFNKLFVELTITNQKKLMKYILNNYKGITPSKYE